ncbi:receptor-type tyrosine-protein phosphatase alpha-like [Haliotis cracherodii]|uniref:receptor-type tyrosine-protein phosphatase alpha-like n=1 Tax=Haliotis cracherodii TaxID=6455 RepID=UPI0039E7420F
MAGVGVLGVVVLVGWIQLTRGTGTNVAEDKPAWMSSIWNLNNHASKAVDGVTLATIYGNSAITKPKETTAWWKVDLQSQVQSALVTLYFSTVAKLRRNGVQLYTSMTNSSDPKQGNLCHSVTGRANGTDIPDVLNVTCPGAWRYLTVYTETYNDEYSAFLDFVEVQVWTCSTGYYGSNCDQSCAARHCKSDSRCDVIGGLCDGGCAAGYQGTDCTQVCTSMMYGPNCASNCSSRHCKTPSSTCDRVTGQCPGGCGDGWKETDCSRTCTSMMYGPNCASNCSSRHCKTPSSTCDRATGQCPGGCGDGWTEIDCSRKCPSGTYGINCKKTCGHCANNNTCHHVNGGCPDGCQAGWKLDLCQKGERNHSEEIDGLILTTELSFSLLKKPNQSEFPVSAVVGAVAGLLVAIVVIVVIVVLVRRRRQRFHDDDINKQVAEFHPKLQENSIYENVALDERTTDSQEPPIKPKPATPASSGTPRDARDKDLAEEDFNEDAQSPDNCYYNTGADAAIRDVAVSELAATVATLRERKDGFEKEYYRLPAGFTAPYQDSQKPENSGKNKFRGYYPYDHNRVRLTPLADTLGSDYINASLMHSYNQRKTYIASQAPNKKTVGDFWRMIWEHSCSAVVMLTGLTEESRVKCERYWPTDGAMSIGLFKIKVEVTQSRANFTTRHMKVTSHTTGESRTVVQFHFTSWPDHGVPDTLALVNYIWLVRQTVAETDGPLLVHCSAGIGRTGTYIAVDSLIDQARGEGVVDVFGYVSAMRGQRKNMIQTPAQYECVFLCLVEMTTYGCTSMDVSNYTNSYSCSGMETTMDGKTFKQLSEMLVLEARKDAPTRHRMWVDGNANFIVRVGPSLTCLRGYLQASAPPPELVKLLWKLVEENDVHNIIVVTPDMGLVEAEGRSKTHGEITLTTTSQTSLSTDVTMNNLQLATKAGRPRQIKMVDVNASLTMEVMTSHLLNHAHLQETSTQPHPVVIVHSDTDRKLAVSLCIMGNILSGIREDARVDVLGHVRTFLRCCPDFQFTQSDVQMFHDFAQQCILRTDPANTYANI